MNDLDALARPAAHRRAHPLAPPRKDYREAARELAAALAPRIAGEVRFDTGSRAAYATDHSIYRAVPVGVVIPRSVDDVIATVEACHARKVPILARGCGSSLSGQTVNVAVVIDFSKYMNRILALDPTARLAKVEPGLINDTLRNEAKKHGLTFAPDPATHQWCTLGGNIGNNSCGAHTVMGGKTVDNVEELEILTYDGVRMHVGATSDDQYQLIQHAGGRRAEIYRGLKTIAERYGESIRKHYPKIPRRVSGYNLDDLLPENGFHVARSLVGSESTCALTLSATVRLIPFPACRALMVLGYEDAPRAADDVPAIRELGPLAIEGFDQKLILNEARKGKTFSGETLLPDGEAWLLVEFGGDSQRDANAKVEAAFTTLRHGGSAALEMRLVEAEEDQTKLWEMREDGVGASRVPVHEEAWPSWEDSAVPPEQLGSYLRQLDKLNKEFGYAYTLYGHFGDGCVHTRMTFGLKTAEGVAKFRRYMEHAADLVIAHGGSLSGEHGDGQSKGELLPRMYGPDLIQAFRDFKTLWDPEWKMNPGKVIDARPLDTDLRYGPDYRPKQLGPTHFQYPQDEFSFAKAMERCFGVGKCRSLGARIMCPSFQGTREEFDNTRGRARLLFEMVRGDTLTHGWDEPAVAEALDLCLQCKGCKHDCPVNVDMATYKAEFLSHYHKKHWRPRNAWSMGLIWLWARFARFAPGLVNQAVTAPGLATATRWLAGITMEREPPGFAAQSFQDWFAARPNPRAQDETRPPVVLWPDTWNNYFLPGTAKAAVAVLEDAGYRVIVPRQRLCCGRPLYDYGMLDLAKQKLREAMDVLRPAARAGIPIVGLEPSCVSVFRDEMLNLFPHDEDAQRLASQVKTFAELLQATDGWKPPKLHRKALVHMHCHQRAVLSPEAEEAVLKDMGLELIKNPAGCCGVAGAFGYETNHYDVAMRIGEHDLLPLARKQGRDTLLISDGFSCRYQLQHGAGRWAMHPAEVILLARQMHGELPEQVPERTYLEPPARPGLKDAATIGVVLATIGLVAGAGLLAKRRA
ncbi:MAG TPA: FAD-linked oxidase C-terminal domain-containing protein [Acetobacteraceae bacterium]